MPAARVRLFVDRLAFDLGRRLLFVAAAALAAMVLVGCGSQTALSHSLGTVQDPARGPVAAT